jgi:hypothetical protein
VDPATGVGQAFAESALIESLLLIAPHLWKPQKLAFQRVLQTHNLLCDTQCGANDDKHSYTTASVAQHDAVDVDT